MNEKLKVLDLFSGIGGFSLGLENTCGFETIAFCEIDKFCRKVLKKHWPDVPIYEDITKLDGRTIKADVITGGYPCQPFSVAGKQLAEADARHLWPEMFRIIQAVRPRWVIAENVFGHIQLGLDTVIAQMEAEGYTVWPFVIPACAVGAPHRRDRVWIICHTEHNGQSAAKIAGGIEARNGSSETGQIETGEPERSDQQQPSMADTGCEFLESTEPEPSEEWTESNAGIGTFSANENCQTGQYWSTEPAICGVDDGLSDEFYKGRVAMGIKNRANRLKALGNSVVPAIPKLIGRAILNYAHNRPIP